MAKKEATKRKKTVKVRTSTVVMKKSSSKIRLPVISSPDTLPLLDPNFTWEKFERFSKQLIKEIYNGHEVKLFGVRGQKQYGIDLVAQDKNGLHFFVQNKRYKTYSVAQFKKAKSELKLKDTKTILLLACEASAELRLEVLGDPNWDIWDVNDISDKVFQLESEARKELVKKYFSIEWAKAFSDYNEFSSIVSPIDFFRNLFDSEKLFNHTIPFLGRDNELSYLNNFVKSNHQALVLNAAGGVGKSRLLWEFSKSSSETGWTVLFIKEGMSPLEDHFQNIKSNKIIFVFDDAHRFDPAPYLVFIYTLKNIKFKIVFSTRPQGRERLKLNLIKNNLESSEIQDYEVKRLTTNEAKTFVSRLLPQINDSHIWPIAKLFADSTLVGVLACNLIKRKSVTLSSLSSEDDIKGKIVSSFTEELSGKIDTKLSNDFVQKILTYISALSPLDYDEGKIDPNFISVTGEKESEINECIADLLHSGILVERGARLRISPDVLSDCILERACYLKNDTSSDFFESLFEKTNEILVSNLLRNVSELDWRKKKGELTSSTLLSSFWKNFKDTSSDDLSTLDSKLETVKGLAYYQPVESYQALLSAIDTLSTFSVDDCKYRFNSCISSVSDICRDIIFAGFNVEKLMMTLWELGKKDKRSLNPHPEHPIRRLSDLCSYERNFPVALYERTLEGLKAIIDMYNSENDHNEPISMLGGFLAKTASSSYSEGYTITISPFHISYENTKQLRAETFKILKKLALSSDLKSAYLAVNIIAGAASPPHSVMGLGVSKAQSQVWHKEISSAVDLLFDIYKKTPMSLIKLHVKKLLGHKIRWDKRSRYKTAITKFLSENPFTIDELKYVPYMFWSYSSLLIQKDEMNSEEIKVEEEKIFSQITKKIVLKMKTPVKILKYIENVVSELLVVSDSVHSWRFSSVLAELINSQKMCDALLINNSDKIEDDFAVFLKKASGDDSTMTLHFVEKALNLKNQSILKSIASSFWWIYEGHESNNDVTSLFEALFKNEDEEVRLSSLNGIRILVNQSNKIKAIEYLMAFDLGSKRFATALFDLVNPYCIKLSELTDLQFSQLLEKIKDIEDLSDHGTAEFISECADRIPSQLFDVLLYRVESKKNSEENFTALPYSGFSKLNLNLNLNLSDDETIKIFDKIVTSLQKEDACSFWLPKLFYNLAKNKQNLAIDYVSSLLKSDDIKIVETGTDLIKKFNNSLVFTNQDLIRDLLNHGKVKGQPFFEEIRVGLLRLGTPMEKSGTAGQPMPQDVALVDNATAAITKAISDHEKQFYMELKEYGEKEIARTIKKNLRFLES